MTCIEKQVTYRGYQLTIHSGYSGSLEVAVHELCAERNKKPRRTVRLWRAQSKLEDLPKGCIDPIAVETLRLLTEGADYLDRRLQKEADSSLERKTMHRGMESGLQLFETSERRGSE